MSPILMLYPRQTLGAQVDKEWQAWADSWMNKKDPQVKSFGLAYMLKGDKGASNTDPYAKKARRSPMKYFIDTHDRIKGSFPVAELTEEQFFAQFDALEKAAHELDVFGHAAHVNLHEGKAFCFMSGPDEDAIRKAHAAIDFPFDSITEVRRVTGADMRPSVARATRS